MSIKRSNYLTFAHERFASDTAPIVIFGQSLGNEDEHLRRALRRDPARRFAVSVRAHPDDNRVIARKLEVLAALPNRDITFFDAATNPLGDPDLRIPEDAISSAQRHSRSVSRLHLHAARHD